MERDERTEKVFAEVDTLITRVRLIRKRVQQGKHIDPSDIDDLKSMLESLRHHCEMHNRERLT